MIAKYKAARAQGEDFCVRGRVVVADGTVVGAGDDCAVRNQYRANRHFAERFSKGGLLQGEVEIVFVGHNCP